MKSNFIAYVDESGDEGFVFNADGAGSSRWFVLKVMDPRGNEGLRVPTVKE